MTARARLLGALTTIAIAAIVLLVVFSAGDAPDEPSPTRHRPGRFGEGALWVTDEDSGTLTPITTAR